ncbi:MAG: NUDIX hydrolase [Bacilli bacterium]|nr:NUDIX hydrolase [Bacilli bacterium]
MELNNPLYKNMGAHVINSIFTIDKGIVKVLLIKRTNNPYKNMWALVSGAMYNNELITTAAKREIKEKTNLENINLEFVNVIDDIDRSPLLRMLGFSFIGLVDIEKVNIMKETNKTSDADWFDINKIPNLAYDHNKILNNSIDKLKYLITNSNILKTLYPTGFTIPEIHKVYESILNKELDRRNFRKKILTSGLVKDTNQTINFKGKKPAKLYIFNDNIPDKKLI